MDNRFSTNSFNNRQTYFYIKFSYKKTHYYLGFYLPCNDMKRVVIDCVLDSHTHSQNSCCTIPMPFVMSQGCIKCPYHVKFSYLHPVNYNFMPYERGHEHIHLRIFNQISSPKRVFSNRQRTSYTMEYIINSNYKSFGQKGFYGYKKTFSQFSYYLNRSRHQLDR